MDGRASAFARTRARTTAATLAAALATLLPAAPAAAADGPDVRWPADGPAIQAATAVAAAYWGATPCGGDVGVLWEKLGGGINAQASWSNAASRFDAPERNTECEVTLNLRARWDWPKLCTVVVHELGHLAGHDHVDDPDDVMFPQYVAPLRECEALPEPAPAPATLSGPPPAIAKAKAKPKPRAKPAPRRTTKRSRTSPKR
jgi:hypothetical protein